MGDNPDSMPLEHPTGPVRPRPSLFWRIFLPNAAVLVVAWSFLAFTPAQVKSPDVSLVEFVYGVVGLVFIFVVNALALRRALLPLGRLRSLMRTANPLRPGRRIPGYGGSSEVVELTEAFNAMLARLERERRISASRALEAQEEERLRLSRELHDELGQALTALLLELENVSRDAPPDVRGQIEKARESARAVLEGLRGLARGLRPEALDDLGLRSALTDLGDRLSAQTGIDIARDIDPSLPRLAPDQELAVYRVAQEALTNSMRHAGAERVELELHTAPGCVVLRVADDGRGLDGREEGAGLTGMRERALAVGADLDIGSHGEHGVDVRLTVPLRGAPPNGAGS